MAIEIHEAGSESASARDDIEFSKEPKKGGQITKTKSMDPEDNQDDEGEKMTVDRAEATELTPAEAFKWNVEGDQSPCGLALKLII